jgi:hypothetical protein
MLPTNSNTLIRALNHIQTQQPVMAHGALGKYLHVAAPRPAPQQQSVLKTLTMEQRAYYIQLIQKFAREAEERRHA